MKLKHPPRRMKPFHAHGVTNDRKNKFYGRSWTYDLIAVPMESVRKTFKFKRIETPKARANLQIWVNNLGPALYNPVTWRLQGFYKARKLSPSRHLKKVGLFIRQYDGQHRIRALEALNFNFIYLFLAFGVPTMSKVQKAEIATLFRPAIRYHKPRRSRCEKCKKRIKWVASRDARKLTYKCPHCGHTKKLVIVYPEPV